VGLDVRETLRDQELITDRSTGVTYWEGAVDVSGRSGASAVRGRGYVEMTGYAETE
jgi:predicted secreted hydrolase